AVRDGDVVLAVDPQVRVREPDRVRGEDTAVEEAAPRQQSGHRAPLGRLELGALVDSLGDVDVDERIALPRRRSDRVERLERQRVRGVRRDPDLDRLVMPRVLVVEGADPPETLLPPSTSTAPGLWTVIAASQVTTASAPRRTLPTLRERRAAPPSARLSGRRARPASTARSARRSRPAARGRAARAPARAAGG